MEYPLKPICDLWLRKIEIAKKKKHEAFGQYAEEASKFYDSDHNWMWREEYSTSMSGFLDEDGSNHMPTFKMTVNKPFEAVALFGPALMHKYPQVMVTPSSPPLLPPHVLGLGPDDEGFYDAYLAEDENDRVVRKALADIKQHYLNWLQVEGGKKSSARQAITEAIVKGLGVLWVDIYTPKGSQIKYPRSTFVSCNDIQKDPDAIYQEDITWISRKRCLPINRASEIYGIPEKDLRGHLQSYESQATPRGRKSRRGKKAPEANETYDLLEFQEVYSKNGFGHRLKGLQFPDRDRFSALLDAMGDYNLIVVAKGIPFPLNLPPEALLTEDEESLFMRCQWPIPFWTDEGSGNGWPMAELHFYEKMNCVWPLSMMKPVIGELRFINWCMSFLADKVAASSTTYIAKAKAAGAEIQRQLQEGLAPYTTIEVADILGKSINDVVSFLQAPNFSVDIWKMVAEVMDMIDKRTGLTELIYGLTGTQMRSATEAEVRDSNLSIRPDDMAERTEDFYSATLTKECIAAVWSLTADDVRGVLGDAGAAVWEEYIQTQDFESVVRDYRYRIEAGSARKPNKNNRIRNLNELGARAMPAIEQFALQGMPGPWNFFMRKMAEAMDFGEDIEEVLLPEPEPGPPQPSPEEEKLAMDQAEFEQEMVQEEEKHNQELKHKQELHRLDVAIKRAQRANSAGNGSSRS